MLGFHKFMWYHLKIIPSTAFDQDGFYWLAAKHVTDAARHLCKNSFVTLVLSKAKKCLDPTAERRISLRDVRFPAKEIELVSNIH